MSQIQGECTGRFNAVREVFARSFAAGREVGASFAATLNGEPVVDLWGGSMDAAHTRPWQRDTLVNVFSTTKAMAALCLHLLADRGKLDLDAPVARYWPEFAQGGKQALPVHWLLSHRAGLAALRPPLPTEALFDWRRMTAALAAETPGWEPGSRSGYHAMTYGFLVGEVLRRVDGRTLGSFFRDEVAKPLGADFWIGLPAAEDVRVAQMVPPSATAVAAAGVAAQPAPDSLLARVMGNPPLAPTTANLPAWRRAEIPAANGHGNASSVARVMAALASGGATDGVRGRLRNGRGRRDDRHRALGEDGRELRRLLDHEHRAPAAVAAHHPRGEVQGQAGGGQLLRAPRRPRRRVRGLRRDRLGDPRRQRLRESTSASSPCGSSSRGRSCGGTIS